MTIQISGGFPAQEALLRRHVARRITASFAADGMRVTLSVDDTFSKPESYRIDGGGEDWHITGSDERGLYYGVGKFLHSACWTEESFAPRATDGWVSPDCPFRCIYFSVHCYNWYHRASPEELEAYLEELLLYGYNAVECIVPVLSIHSFEEALYREAVEKIRTVFTAARNMGMKTMFTVNPNQGLQSAPHEWDADLSYDTVGIYRGWAGRNLCPNKPGAVEYLRGIWLRCLEQFLDIGIDYVVTWPYDEGGCGCGKCAPWGANGFDKLSRLLAQDVKRLYPEATFIYSTWIFDVPTDQQEYSTLYRRLAAGEMDYVDYLMTDAHDTYPRYVLEHPVIRPIVNFPEISMWKLYPWGGFGATPMPRRFEAIWDSAKEVLSGGMPYSEGLYEDISKVQFIGYYWDKDARYTDILCEYAAYEFGGDVAEDAVRLMELIEENHVRVARVEEPDFAAAEQAWKLAEKMDARMSEKRKTAWRWRILYIRAVLDGKRYAIYHALGMHGEEDLHTLRHDDEEKQLLKHDAEAQSLYQELRTIYHCFDRVTGRNWWTLPVVQGAM